MIGDNIKKIVKNNKGFSLIEMLVATMMFVILTIMITSIFQTVVKGQYQAIAVQSVQESLRFTLEMISKELRSAKKNYIDTDADGIGDAKEYLDGYGSSNKVYNTGVFGANGDDLHFVNKYGEHIRYYIDDGDKRLYINRDGTSLPITPDELEVSNLNIRIDDDVIGAFHEIQPIVTIRMDAKLPNYVYKVEIQTTITSRYYE